MSMDNGFDPAEDDINREKHGLLLAFGHKIFGDADHLIIPSIRERDGEERFKVIDTVREKLFTDTSPGREVCPGSYP